MFSSSFIPTAYPLHLQSHQSDDEYQRFDVQIIREFFVTQSGLCIYGGFHTQRKERHDATASAKQDGTNRHSRSRYRCAQLDRVSYECDFLQRIGTVLKEHQAGLSAVDLCRKHGISDATFYKWRSRFGQHFDSRAEIQANFECRHYLIDCASGALG